MSLCYCIFFALRHRVRKSTESANFNILGKTNFMSMILNRKFSFLSLNYQEINVFSKNVSNNNSQNGSRCESIVETGNTVQAKRKDYPHSELERRLKFKKATYNRSRTFQSISEMPNQKKKRKLR